MQTWLLNPLNPLYCPDPVSHSVVYCPCANPPAQSRSPEFAERADKERTWRFVNREERDGDMRTGLGLTKVVILVFELVDRACNSYSNYGLYHGKASSTP